MKKLLIVISLFHCLFLSSCVSYMVKKAGLTQTSPYIKPLPSTSKEVYFVGMRHLGREGFYKNSKTILDSFSRLNYTFYVETIGLYKEGKKQVDTLAMKKFRKVKGLDISKSWKDMDDSILKELIRKYKLVGQPGYGDLGASNYKIVDLSYPDFIKSFEDKYGVIELDSCDLNTQLGHPFNCRTISKEMGETFHKEFILGERNKFVAQTIKNSSDKKIVVIFGLKHYDGIKKELRSLDN